MNQILQKQLKTQYTQLPNDVLLLSGILKQKVEKGELSLVVLQQQLFNLIHTSRGYKFFRNLLLNTSLQDSEIVIAIYYTYWSVIRSITDNAHIQDVLNTREHLYPSDIPPLWILAELALRTFTDKPLSSESEKICAGKFFDREEFNNVGIINGMTNLVAYHPMIMLPLYQYLIEHNRVALDLCFIPEPPKQTNNFGGVGHEI